MTRACLCAAAGEATCEPSLLLLGPVRLRGEAGDAGLGGVRPRRLLAMLAAHAGDAVSADRLIDAIWGADPPRTAKKNLHTYLWQLRRSLATASCDRISIAAQHSGYLLRAAPGELDWDCFRQMCSAAARALSAEPGRAAHLLRQALDVWRGPAFADVADGMSALAPRVAAMEEARMAALEQRIEADLRAGLDRELVTELAELTIRHPLREHLRAQQMVALHRCGRPAEALLAYHDLRRILATQLGTDPSPKLRALFEAMLRADPGLCTARQTAAVSSVPPPLPEADPGTGGRRVLAGEQCLGQRAADDEARAFQGRRSELATIRQLLAAGRLPRIVRLHGPAGIGKTAFAYALTRACAARGWPVAIIDSRDFRHDAASLSEIVAARCAAAQVGVDGGPLLLMFDTFEEMQDIERDLWEIVLPGVVGRVLVVLSGRRRADILARSGRWDGLVSDIELAGLPVADARRLARLHGAASPAVTDRILAFADGNPLLVILAAQHAQAVGGDGAGLSAAAARQLIGRMTREISGPELRRLVDAASLVRTFNQELLAEMTGGEISREFAALCRLSFVRVTRQGARLHDLVREDVAADLSWRAPEAVLAMRGRAHAYLTRRARWAAEPGPYIQELLHLAASTSGLARFYAPAERPHVRVRAARPDDLPRLRELCHTGISRFGFPPAERLRQLDADFGIALRHFAVAEDRAGRVTGFAYTIWLNAATWQAAAATRRKFFAVLPEPELAAIRTTPDGLPPPAYLIAGATHLPGLDHVGAALREYLFPRARAGRTMTDTFTAYHLLTRDCPELPEIIDAGLTRRSVNIDLGEYMVDEWLLRFGEGGLVGWLAEAAGVLI